MHWQGSNSSTLTVSRVGSAEVQDVKDRLPTAAPHDQHGLQCLEQACMLLKDAKAQVMLGNMHLKGKGGLPKDNALAKDMYEVGALTVCGIVSDVIRLTSPTCDN